MKWFKNKEETEFTSFSGDGEVQFKVMVQDGKALLFDKFGNEIASEGLYHGNIVAFRRLSWRAKAIDDGFAKDHIDNYPLEYGSWGGNNLGHEPDMNRCCERVHHNHLFSQCNNRASVGPFCRTHHPDIVEKKRARREYKQALKNRESLERKLNSGVYSVIIQIANGHNDARGLAQEAVKKFGLELPPMPKDPDEEGDL